MHAMTETPATETALPTRRPERIVEGVGHQRVDIFNPQTGEYSHQATGRGTAGQVRANALKGFTHPSKEDWHHLSVAANPTLDGADAKRAHIAECPSCTRHVDEEIAGYLPDDSDEDLAEFIAKCHHAAYLKLFGE